MRVEGVGSGSRRWAEGKGGEDMEVVVRLVRWVWLGFIWRCGCLGF